MTRLSGAAIMWHTLWVSAVVVAVALTFNYAMPIKTDTLVPRLDYPIQHSKDYKEVLKKLTALSEEMKVLKQELKTFGSDIEDRITELEESSIDPLQSNNTINRIDPSIPERNKFGNQRQTAEMDWMDNLTENKQAEVDQVFMEIGQEFPIEDFKEVPFKALHQQMVDQQTALKERLKLVLPEQNYQAFIKSLPPLK
ncbi:MAG: hypothetical protein ACREAU_03560 [Nitrosopumilaceae archaeon]